MIVATAGHVDHGKTALVKALTGVDTDRLPEEKKRGLTIELGFAYHDLGDGRTTGFIDVPGHERFIRTMVAGVSGIDVVMFIIAADDGPMPQTHEHLAILDLLGVTRGVFAITKIDRVAPERVTEVVDTCRKMLAGSALADSPVVPVSAHAGEGIETLRETLLAIGRDVPERALNGNFRLAVDRSFILKGAGRVVTGTVFSGAVRTNDALWHVPGDGQEIRVRGIHAQNAEAEQAVAGQRTALNVTGTSARDGEIRRGDWIVAGGADFATQRLDADVRILAGESRACRNRTPVHVHIGAADVTGRLVTFDGGGIEPGDSALVQLMLDRPLHAVRGDRIVLRDQSARRTLGGGEVLDPIPDVRGLRRQQRAVALKAMRGQPAAAAFATALEVLPDGVAIERFARAWNLTAAELEALLDTVEVEIVGEEGARVGLEPRRWQALRAQIVPSLEACHAAAPDEAGVTPDALNRELPERLATGTLDRLIEQCLADGTVERAGGALRLPGHAVRRSAADEAVWRRLEPLLDRDDHKVPVLHDLAEPLKMNPKLLEGFLTRSAKQGYLVRVSNKRYYLPRTLTTLEATVRELAASQDDGVFSVADFRNRTGIGRNAVVEILEYFDRVGLTRRHGQVRKLIDAQRR